MVLVPFILVAFIWSGAHQSPYQGPHFEPDSFRSSSTLVVSK